MLDSILTGTGEAGLTAGQMLLCMGTSLALGMVLALLHTYKNTYSKNFIVTLGILPVIVQAVIMLVNGNLGTGIAVMGAFSLVRFRSVPGNSREIGSVFLARAVGLAAGMGYLAMAALLAFTVGGAGVILVSLPVWRSGRGARELKVTIPENLDYFGIFDDIFERYVYRSQLQRVRTVNMGSLYELCYRIDLRSEAQEKEMLDAIRCRNGNLGIVCGRVPESREEL